MNITPDQNYGLGSQVTMPEILISSEPVPYLEAVEMMQDRVQDIHLGKAPELLWFLEHPPLLTLGTSAKHSDIGSCSLPVYKTGRGGQVTYHGPGQRVVYALLDLNKRGKDLRRFIHCLEEWLVKSLREIEITALRRAGRVGLWVPRDISNTCDISNTRDILDKSVHPNEKQPTLLEHCQKEMRPEHKSLEDKIAAIGVRVSKWVTWHGLSINIDPDLSVYDQFTPCGIREHGVTSFRKLGSTCSMENFDRVLIETFNKVF